MNILYLIGNGFDINLGMRTRYTDFYEHYKSLPSSNNLIKDLKDEIAQEIINWSDLELALGKYTSKLDGLKDFDTIHEDLVNNLCDYLNAEEDKFNFKSIKYDKFLDHLHKPESFLTAEEIQQIKSFRSQWKNYQWNVNIITFNYTTTIEKIIDGDIQGLEIGKHHTNKIVLNNLRHVHGYTNDRTILGVNDISQIHNLEFHNNEEVLESIIKTKCNKVQGHNIDKVCEEFIKEAQLICVFGCSIGDTDKHWWNLVGENLKSNSRLIIFSVGEEVPDRFAYKSARNKRASKKLFLSKTNLTESEKEQFEKNIYIGLNTRMFSIK